MLFKILETDEAVNDLTCIAFNAYDYTRDKESGFRFLELYNRVASELSVHPMKFRNISLEHRNYRIHILPFGNYNLFYIVCRKIGCVFVLRVLYQKQDWCRILRYEDYYHIQGKAI